MVNELLSAQTVDRIFDVQADGPDLVLGVPMRFGIGYGLAQTGGRAVRAIRREDLLLGRLGRLDGADEPDRRTTAAYVMNKMGQGTLGNERTARYAKLIYEAIS